jgi:hypothetical protein
MLYFIVIINNINQLFLETSGLSTGEYTPGYEVAVGCRLPVKFGALGSGVLNFVLLFISLRFQNITLYFF